MSLEVLSVSLARFTGVFYGGPFRAHTPGIDDGRFRSLEGDFKSISISDQSPFSLSLSLSLSISI